MRLDARQRRRGRELRGPSAAAYALYGWMLSAQYSAGAASVIIATALPDPRALPAPTQRDTPPRAVAARAIARQRRRR